MTNRNRIFADQNVFHQQSHDLLTFDDAKRLCSTAQAGEKCREGFCQAQECGTIIGLISQRLQLSTECLLALEKAFRTGEGLPWHQHDRQVFDGTERFYRSGYIANLVSNWIPSVAGVQERLTRGGCVADIGCGHGASTLLMAQAFPNSRFFGFDSHAASIEAAKERAAAKGLSDRVQFAVAGAKDFPGTGYDLVTIFDALHDLGDPAGAAAHVRSTLKPDGAWMIVEPYAEDRLEANFNPVGRAYFSASTLLCTPCSLSQEGGLALGAQACEARLRAVVTNSGFGLFRRAAQRI